MDKMRVGIGYDIHRLRAGARLVLGGVEIPGPLGAVGHSDADAALHAVADAVLGAAALGDLGHHFPDTAQEWKDRDSRDILAAVVEMARSRAGLRVHNVDVNIVLEAPRIAGSRDRMREAIAGVLGVPLDRVSVKARTAEGLGPVGRGEAVEAQAVVLMVEEPEAEAASQ